MIFLKLKNDSVAWHSLIDHMQHSHHPRMRRRRRTKQTLQAPRRMDRNAEQELKKLVWVTVGKTEHQAWLLEDVKGKSVVSIRWETTRTEERVPVLSIRYEAPDNGRRSRRRRTSVQDSLTDLDDRNIQFPRKRKRQQTKSKTATITKTVPIKQEPLEGGRMESGEEKVESTRLAGTLSVLSDIRSGSSAKSSSMRPKKEAIMTQRKKSMAANSIVKTSLSELATAKGSAISDKWRNEVPTTRSSTNANEPAASAIACSTKNSKDLESVAAVPASKHEEQSNEDYDGYLI